MHPSGWHPRHLVPAESVSYTHLAQTAAVHTLSSCSLTDANDELFPTRVKPVDSVEAIQPDGWIHTFPHSSVTVLSLHRN